MELPDRLAKTLYYVAFDPGEKSNIGWCAFDETGHPVIQGQIRFEELEELYHWLELEPIRAVIYEGYKIRARTARYHIGSRVETIQAIGSIKSFCVRNRFKAVEQDPGILTIAEKLTGHKMPADHSKSHWVSAYLHGSFYLINTGVRPSLLELIRAAEQENRKSSSQSGEATGEL